jgi:hypothetical protein
MAKTLDEAYADANKGYANAVTLPRWNPPEGNYTALLTMVVDRVRHDRKANVDAIAIAAVCEIMDGEFTGRRFKLFDVSPLHESINMLKNLAEMATGKSGALKEDVEALKALCGQLALVVRVTHTPREKGGEFVNAYVDEVLKNTPAPATTAAPATDAPAAP